MPYDRALAKRIQQEQRRLRQEQHQVQQRLRLDVAREREELEQVKADQKTFSHGDSPEARRHQQAEERLMEYAEKRVRTLEQAERLQVRTLVF